MARSRHQAAPSVNLFPFLSVLAGVMGTLTLIIGSMIQLSLRDANKYIDPSPDGSRKTPVYVECRGEGLVVHPLRWPIARERVADPDGPWAGEVQLMVQRKNTHYVILLVRPDGIDVFRDALTVADAEGIDIGYDAVDSGGDIIIARNRKERLP
ncbi:MAG: hypothetical protein FJ276_15595 [Planctomycetes bacterium]|nr:hypothetical protein [Planctomycetota bacterium]